MEARLREMNDVSSEFSDDESFDDLVEKTRSDRANVRAIAAGRLTFSEDRRAAPVLMDLMSDPSAKVRGMAAIGLGQHEAEEARGLLLEHLKSDPNGDVRSMCVSSLGYIGGADEAIVSALDDPHQHVRMSAVTALNVLNKTSAAGRLLGMLGDSDWTVRYFTCCALIDFNTGDQRIVDALHQLHEMPEAREMVENFAYGDVINVLFERYEDDTQLAADLDSLEDESPEETLRILREKYGEEMVPYPPEDPLGDMISQAQELLGQA